MRLEQQLLYEPRTEEKQREYLVVGNLYGLSAVVLYSSDILRGGSGPLSSGVGSSRYSTWMSNPQPAPDLEIKTPNSYGMINAGRVVPTSSKSLLYLNSRGEILGGIENLNPSEMSFLLKKHFGK